MGAPVGETRGGALRVALGVALLVLVLAFVVLRDGSSNGSGGAVNAVPAQRGGSAFVLETHDASLGRRPAGAAGGAPMTSSNRDKPRYTQAQVQQINDAMTALAEDVLRRIEVGPPKCLPRICAAPYGFRDKNSTRGIKVALASVPGSGNTWVRSVIRAGTRLYTGSVYRDGSLARKGYEGEFLKASDPATAVVKTHYAFHYAGAPYRWTDGVLHVMRSPFDAFLAECNRQRGGHTGVAEDDDKLVRRCGRWSARKVERLANMYSVFERESQPELRSRDDAVVRVHLSEDRGIPVATAFYEDMEREFTRTTAYMLAFLKVFVGDAEDDAAVWPDVYEGVVCALHESQQEEAFHRHASSKPPQLLFRDEEDQPNELAKVICQRTKGIWNENKWGPCNGHFQKERPDVVKYKRLHDIPETVCAEGERADGN